MDKYPSPHTCLLLGDAYMSIQEVLLSTLLILLLHTVINKEGRKCSIFNNALLYLRLYDVRHVVKDVRHVVKDHSDSERENPLQPHGLLFPIRVLLYAPSHKQDSSYH